MEFNEQEGIISQEKASVNTKKAINGKIVFLIIIVIVLITATLSILPKSNVAIVVNRPSIVTPAPVIITATPPPQPSKWASDSAIIKIEKRNQDLGNEIKNADFSEPVLSLPNIDTNVDFTR